MVAVAELWETLSHAIHAYTGLSPAAFFTAVAVAAAIYHLVASFLAPPPPPPRYRDSVPEESEPLPPPVQLGEITEEELKAYDGSDPKKPLLMAIKNQIYDVTQSRVFYGPGGPYALFAGRDASRALAKMSFEPQDLTSDISGLGPFELDALQDWEYKFMSKYVKVGTIKKSEVVSEEAADVSSSNTENAPENHANVAETVPKTEGDAKETDSGAKDEDVKEKRSDDVVAKEE
ncbi:membrane steroid-binding protein 1-like isoform X2 [Carex rostrata]